MKSKLRSYKAREWLRGTFAAVDISQFPPNGAAKFEISQGARCLTQTRADGFSSSWPSVGDFFETSNNTQAISTYALFITFFGCERNSKEND